MLGFKRARSFQAVYDTVGDYCVEQITVGRVRRR